MPMPDWFHLPSLLIHGFHVTGNISFECDAYITGYKIDIYTSEINEITLQTTGKEKIESLPRYRKDLSKHRV